MQGVASNANPNNRQITVRQLTSTKTATDPVNATGVVNVKASTATGALTFHNGSISQQTIAPTAITNANGIQIIADQNVTIAGANPNNGQPGVATVSAHAVSAGANGNIAAGSISGACCLAGGFITVTNLDAFKGGQDARNYHILQEGDITPVTNAHQGALKSDAQKEIQGQIKPGEKLLLQDNVNCNDPKTTSDVLPGDHGANVTTAHVTVSVTCNAQVYDSNAVQTIAQNLLKQKASRDPTLAGYVLTGNIVIQTQPLDGPITFSVVAKGIWAYQWTDANKQKLLDKIKGKSSKEAQTILKNYPGVSSAKVEIDNGGTTLPTDTKQIKLVVNTVKGL
jgi:hypothetical protein